MSLPDLPHPVSLVHGHCAYDRCCQAEGYVDDCVCRHGERWPEIRDKDGTLEGLNQLITLASNSKIRFCQKLQATSSFIIWRRMRIYEYPPSANNTQ